MPTEAPHLAAPCRCAAARRGYRLWQPIFLVLPWAVAAGAGEAEDCKHGTWDQAAEACRCDAPWTNSAEITDTIDFLGGGACVQFRCESSGQCRDVLALSDASCPVPGWSCYCGWQGALLNGGKGYATASPRGGGKCMGVAHTALVWSAAQAWWIMSRAWVFFLSLAAFCLPVGCKRSVCDHQWPSLWNSLRRLVGRPPTCHGECLAVQRYSISALKDDLAWSIYVLDVGAWSYAFFCTFCLMAVCMWSLLLWVVLVACLAVLLAVALRRYCREEDAMASAAEERDPGSRLCGDCRCAPDLWLCCCWAPGSATGRAPPLPVGESAPGYHAFFAAAGRPPPSALWGTARTALGAPDEDGGRRCLERHGGCCACCGPLTWLLYVFPVMPENAWGGLLGFFVLGTHRCTPTERLYQGGNPLTEFLRLGWRRTADLHSDGSWRQQVHDLLFSEDSHRRAPL